MFVAGFDGPIGDVVDAEGYRDSLSWRIPRVR